jgi:phenol hydroxylase P1 protein
MLSKVGIALGDNSDALLEPAKTAWLDAPELQGFRRFIEQLLVEPDWAVGAYALDLCDQLLYPLLTRHLDEAALIGGAGAYSLLMQHFGTWFTDQRKWLDALYASWLSDPEYAASNAAALSAATVRWLPQIIEAVNDYAAAIDAVVSVDAVSAVATTAAAIRERLTGLGIEVSA